MSFVEGQIGFVGELGLEDIRNIDADNPIVNSVLNYQAPLNPNDWDNESDKFSDHSSMLNPLDSSTLNERAKIENLSSKTPAMIGASYVVRSMIPKRYDIVAVFQVLREDQRDKSIIIAWKILKDFPLATTDRPSRLKRSGFDGFPGKDGKDGEVRINGKKMSFPMVVSTKAKYEFLLNEIKK